MSLEAAARRCCIVEHRERRFLVEAPTMGTVIVAIGLFAKQIAAVSKLAVETPSILAGTREDYYGMLSDILTDTSDGRAGEVLETCCSLKGGSRGDVLSAVSVDPELAWILGAAVLGLCDVARCFHAAGWAEIGKKSIEELESLSEARPSGWVDLSGRKLEIGLDAIARRYSCAIHDVLTWPFEEVLLVDDIAALLANPAATERLEASSHEFPLGLMDIPGIGYTSTEQ